MAAGGFERTSLAVVEAAYRLDAPTDAWLAGVATAAQPALDHGVGLLSVAFHVGPGAAVHFDAAVTTGDVPHDVMDLLNSVTSGLSRAEVHGSWASPRALATSSSELERIHQDIELREWRPFTPLHAFGIQDSLAAKMVDSTLAGVMLLAPLRREMRVPAADEARWQRVMAHVLAGLRLRGALADSDGEAVLDPAGRVLHAEADAQSRTARDALQDAAATVERARSRAGRRDPDAALKAWKGLVSGRWSLVDRFDRDGRRFLVARRNDPSVPRPGGLTDRERQVASYAALGYSNKHIAYALGLAQSTVSNHLRTAMRRLGVQTLTALREIVYANPIQQDADES